MATASIGDLDAAAAALHRACELGPEDGESCYFFARDLYALGHYEAARAPFEKALRAATPAVAAKVYRAVALNFAALGSPTKAEQYFVKAVELAGRRPHDGEDPRVDYGAFLFRQGRTESALIPLQQAAHDMPSSPRANLELARVLLHLDKPEAAAACLEKAVRLEPENFNAHLLLGQAYLRLGRISEGDNETRLVEREWARKNSASSSSK
jgi:Tfp pilus assembly protein PilF